MVFGIFGELPIPPLFNSPELSSASDRAKLFHDSGISLPVFPARTNLKLNNNSLTPKLVKKVIMSLDMSKASGSDCIPVVFLKNCEPELSYILAELFNNCLKFSRVLLQSTAKNYHSSGSRWEVFTRISR